MITAKIIEVSVNTSSQQKWTLQYEVNYRQSLTGVEAFKTNNNNNNTNNNNNNNSSRKL